MLMLVSALALSCENPDLTDPNENQEQTGNDNKPSGGEGEGETESVKSMTITVERVTATKVVFKGTTKKTAPDIEVGIYWSKVQGSHINDCEKVSTYKITNGSFELTLDDLDADTKYYCYPYLFMNGARELGDEFDVKTAQPKFTIDNVSVDGLTVTFTGYADSDCSVGIYCSTSSPTGFSYYTHHSVNSEENNYTLTLNKLSYCTTYYYCTYVSKDDIYNPEYGIVKSFTTENPTIIVEDCHITDNGGLLDNQVAFTGNVKLDCEGGILYSTSPNITIGNCLGKIDLSNRMGVFTQTVNLLRSETYYYCTYYFNSADKSYVYGELKSIKTEPFLYNDLSVGGTANCYIVSKSGAYMIKATKGNSSESVEAVTAEVLWESFGTSVTPSVGDLIQHATYKDNYICFNVHEDFKEGNAVIAAKDADGEIVWSWHIWMTDQPQEHVYYNNAGTMMDRNLGATSATPGDVGALGLHYQWGRKDPFLGSSSISEDVEAKSTIEWESPVYSSSSTGTIDYAIAHPTTFIVSSVSSNNNYYDWYYNGYSDYTRWTGSGREKSIYDPCPLGWRVPYGKPESYYEGNIWSKALGSKSSFTDSSLYDSTNKGINFSGKFGSASSIWYPVHFFRDASFGSIWHSGASNYWSGSTTSGAYYYSYAFGLNEYGAVVPFCEISRAQGAYVRCLKE